MFSLLPSFCCPCWFSPVTSTENCINEIMESEFTDDDLFDSNSDYYADDKGNLVDFTQSLLSTEHDFDDGIGMSNEETIMRSLTNIPKTAEYFDPTL